MRVLAIALFAAAATAQASVVDRKRASRNLQDDVAQDNHQGSKNYKDGCGLRGQLCCHTIGENPDQPPCLHGLGCRYYEGGDDGKELGVCTSECGGDNEPCCYSVISTDGDSTCECAPGLFYNIELNMCKPCGSFGNTPCPDVGCNAGLVPDGTGWYQIDRRRSLAAEDRELGWGQVILYDEVCVPCGGEGQIPCPACDGCEGAPSGTSTCNEGLSPQISYEYSGSGITLCQPCGTFGAPPCPDVGCNTGLVSDGTGWFFLSQGLTADPIALTLFFLLFNEFGDGIFGRRLSETTTSTLEGSKNKRRLGEIWTGDDINSPPAVCVPCGELAQIPCPPCEGSCATCSEGLVATNLLGYIEADDFNTTDIPLEEIDGFLSLLVGLNICLPCGAEGQPPCEDGCGSGLASDINDDGKCVKCGLGGQPPCEEGCASGLVITHDPDTSFTSCQSCGNLGETPCIDTEGLTSSICNEGLSPQSDSDSDKTLCLPCGTFAELPCPDTECASGLTPDGFGWFNLVSNPLAFVFLSGGDFGRRLSETPAAFAATNKRRLEQVQSDFHEGGLTGLCAPCGEFGQIPCPTCEGDCTTCSEGLIATNPLGYFNEDLPPEIPGPDNTTIPVEAFYLDLISINVCLPCGAEGQPPCEDTKCNHGLAPDINDDGKCVKCGRGGQPPCEDGCANGFSIDPDIVSTKCQACGNENEMPCDDTGCNPGLAPDINDDGKCVKCGRNNQPPCEDGCDTGFSINPTFLKTLCTPCGNEKEIPCIDTRGPASSFCNEGVSPQFHPEFEMDKTLCLPCGSGIGELPCPDTECASGLTPDGFGWFNLASNLEALSILFEGFGDDDERRRLSETFATFAATNKRRLDGHSVFPLGLCAPCGEFGQIPCAPCEGGCTTCSEGLIATNLLGYGDTISDFSIPGPDDLEYFLSLFVSTNICLPCGAEGQPPCEDTGCNHGLVPDDDGKCVECGGYGEPCCCDSSEYESVYFNFLWLVDDGGASDSVKDLGAEMVKAAIENANNDPSKCLVGCASGTDLRCGVNGMCIDPDYRRH